MVLKNVLTTLNKCDFLKPAWKPCFITFGWVSFFVIEVKSFCVCFLNPLFDWRLPLNLKCYILINVEKFILLTSGHNPIYCKRLCHQADPTSSVILPFLFKSVLPLALDACSYFALWETFSLVTVANLLPTSKRSVAILPSQTNVCTALFLHPAHLIIPVLWGMSECIHPTTAKPVSSLYSLIGLHYKGMWMENNVQVKVFSSLFVCFTLK